MMYFGQKCKKFTGFEKNLFSDNNYKAFWSFLKRNLAFLNYYFKEQFSKISTKKIGKKKISRDLLRRYTVISENKKTARLAWFVMNLSNLLLIIILKSKHTKSDCIFSFQVEHFRCTDPIWTLECL